MEPRAGLTCTVLERSKVVHPGAGGRRKIFSNKLRTNLKLMGAITSSFTLITVERN